MNPFQFVRSLARLLRGRPRVPESLKDNLLLQTILQRRSVRSFSRRPIPQEEFDAILEAGRLAPCTVNLQSWSFGVFDGASWQRTFGRPLPFKAQRAVIVMGDLHRVKSLGIDFPDSPLVETTIAVMNASLAAMNMNLAAEALGVSSVIRSACRKMSSRSPQSSSVMPQAAIHPCRPNCPSTRSFLRKNTARPTRP
jgi:hypothetical protein